jgi:hypothetical protein
MSAVEVLQLAASCGILSGGLGIARWALLTERRLLRLEMKAGF